MSITPAQQAEADLRFSYHPPQPDQIPRFGEIREKAREFALLIFEVTPASTEQTRSLEALDEVVMLANAAIARNEMKNPAPD